MFQTDIMLILCVLLFNFVLVEPSAEGWTDPSEPIIGLIGSEIRIRCGVNGSMYSSKNLSFFNNTDQSPVDRKYVREINESVIEMIMHNASEQESMIVCQLNGQHGISYNDIKIGRLPEEIYDLKCQSNNWDNMNCSFPKPYNPVAVHYNVKYRPVTSGQVYECKQLEEKNPKIFYCNIPKGHYRRVHEIFEFIITAGNALGTTETVITINNFDNVIPAKPEGFKSIKIMSDSVVLGWKVNSELRVFPKPFDYEFSIEFPKECEPKPEKVMVSKLAVDDTETPTNFTKEFSLKFANTWYDIKVRMRVSSAPDIEKMWSDWSVTQFKTLMRRPDNPPAVDKGSFNIGPGGDVYIYWKHLHRCYQNGVNYSYAITSDNKYSEIPNEIHHYYATYTKDRFNLEKDTKVEIRNFNNAGMSEKASTIIIPARRIDDPTKIKKILKNGSYQLSWSQPNNPHETITSYTVFWCVSKSELPNSCEGSIDFVRRLPTETHYELTSNQTINFAVAANSKTSTSGMVWARCTTANSNEIGKIKTIWIPRLVSTEIEVEWKLECTDSGIVAGYQLEYCPIKEPKTLECVQPEKKLNITGSLYNPKHTISGLLPYTTYKIIIRMFSNSTMGPGSDPLANTTLEAGK